MARLGEPEDGAGQSEHHTPNQNTSPLHRPLGLQCDGLHWVADTQVPVDRDASEEENGAVEVKVKKKSDQPAHEVPEDPAVSHDVTSNEKWQRQAIHEVCGGQVDHVDQRGVPSLGPPKGAVEDHRVERDAENECE